MSFKDSDGSAREKILSTAEQQLKINEVKKIIGPAVDKFPIMCSDASILRFLRARNWNTHSASKMLKEAIRWRVDYKPEKICWEDVAQEAETGKVYKANYYDKYGRTVLIMRPGYQCTSSVERQIKYLVYCMENAILDLKPDQEQMVWLIDFQRWNMASISMKVTRETAHVLQDRYPERLGLAILYNPPKVFESFWLMVKPFLEKKTSRKVKFVYSDKPHSQKVMESLFDAEKLEFTFGGKNTKGINYEDYAKHMKEEDQKMANFIASGCPLPSDKKCSLPESKQSEDLVSETVSETSDEGSNLERIDDDIEVIDLLKEISETNMEGITEKP